MRTISRILVLTSAVTCSSVLAVWQPIAATIGNLSLTSPPNVTAANAVNQAGAVVNYPAPITSSPDGAVVVGCAPVSGSFFPLGATTVTCTASDVDDIVIRTFTITVNDTQPPTITSPANLTFTASDPAGSTVTYAAPIISDNAPGVSADCTPASGSVFPIGINTVTCTATDGTLNTATATFTVTVLDGVRPTMVAPANIIVSLNSGSSVAVTWAPPVVSDNRPGVGAPTCIPVSGSAFGIGATTINCSVADAQANSTNASFTVTVLDGVAPVIVVPADIAVTINAGSTAVAAWAPPQVSDNQPGVGAPNCSPASGSTFAAGTTLVTCTVQDARNNSASAQFTVTVTENQPARLLPATGGASRALLLAAALVLLAGLGVRRFARHLE